MTRLAKRGQPDPGRERAPGKRVVEVARDRWHRRAGAAWQARPLAAASSRAMPEHRHSIAAIGRDGDLRQDVSSSRRYSRSGVPTRRSRPAARGCPRAASPRPSSRRRAQHALAIPRRASWLALITHPARQLRAHRRQRGLQSQRAHWSHRRRSAVRGRGHRLPWHTLTVCWPADAAATRRISPTCTPLNRRRDGGERPSTSKPEHRQPIGELAIAPANARPRSATRTRAASSA